ncbi:MAG: sulfotransferase [Cyanobacteria bacterium J06627_28]
MEMIQGPTFLLIGAAKAGTTSLTKYLTQHPQIFVCPRREPNFFVFADEFGGSNEKPNAAGQNRYDALKDRAIRDIELYHNQFEAVTDEKIFGEASPLYLCTPKTAERIHRYKSGMKLVVILRNPADRAFSHFVYAVANGRESLSNFDAAIAQEDISTENIWIGARHYIRLGFYYSQLKPYFQIFDRSQIKVCLYEDFSKDSTKVMKEILSFLDVDNNFIPDMTARHNQSLIPKNKTLHHFLMQQNIAAKTIKTILPEQVINLAKSIRARNLVKSNAKLSAQARQNLMAIYREDILELQALIDKDLSCWLVPDLGV